MKMEKVRLKEVEQISVVAELIRGRAALGSPSVPAPPGPTAGTQAFRVTLCSYGLRVS